MSVTKAQGDALVAAARAGKLTLRGEAIAFPAYMYDLRSRRRPGIPTDLAFAPRPRDLAQIDHRFLGAAGARLRGPRRLPPYRSRLAGADSSRSAGQSTRTDYVTAGPAVRLVPGCAATSPAGNSATNRSRTHPGSGTASTGSHRSPGRVSAPATGARRVTVTSCRQRAVRERRQPCHRPHVGAGGEHRRCRASTSAASCSPSQPYQAVFPFAPTPDLAEYRFVQDTTRPADPWRTSIRTHTAWTFQSQQTAWLQLDPLPLLQLDYAVATDLAEQRPARAT